MSQHRINGWSVVRTRYLPYRRWVNAETTTQSHLTTAKLELWDDDCQWFWLPNLLSPFWLLLSILLHVGHSPSNYLDRCPAVSWFYRVTGVLVLRLLCFPSYQSQCVFQASWIPPSYVPKNVSWSRWTFCKSLLYLLLRKCFGWICVLATVSTAVTSRPTYEKIGSSSPSYFWLSEFRIHVKKMGNGIFSWIFLCLCLSKTDGSCLWHAKNLSSAIIIVGNIRFKRFEKCEISNFTNYHL